MALLIARDIVEDYTVIFLTIVLGTVVGGTTEAIPGYIFTVLSSMIILIVFKVLYNVIVIIK